MNAMTVGGDPHIDEAIRVQANLQRRRTALLVGVVVTAVVGVMGFWAVDFGLLGIARGWLTYGGAVLFGALVGGGSWFLLRPKERAFEALPAPVEERPPADDDARAFAR